MHCWHFTMFWELVCPSIQSSSSPRFDSNTSLLTFILRAWPYISWEVLPPFSPCPVQELVATISSQLHPLFRLFSQFECSIYGREKHITLPPYWPVMADYSLYTEWHVSQQQSITNMSTCPATRTLTKINHVLNINFWCIRHIRPA